MTDKDEFFREATLRMCGSLEIEDGLHDCFQYIAQHLPADCMYFQRYYRDQGEMRIVARASADGGKRMHLRVPLPEPPKANINCSDTEHHDGRMPVLPTTAHKRVLWPWDC